MTSTFQCQKHRRLIEISSTLGSPVPCLVDVPFESFSLRCSKEILMKWCRKSTRNQKKRHLYDVWWSSQLAKLKESYKETSQIHESSCKIMQIHLSEDSRTSLLQPSGSAEIMQRRAWHRVAIEPANEETGQAGDGFMWSCFSGLCSGNLLKRPETGKLWPLGTSTVCLHGEVIHH